jgi:hypothetical protein
VGIRNCPKYAMGIRVFLKAHKNLEKRKTKIVASKVFNHGSQKIWKRSNDHL